MLELEPVVAGLDEPLFVTHAGDGSGDIYVVEKSGVVKVVRKGAARGAPFLDISARVRSSAFEQGLLGLAFHPNYTSNGYLFVNYTDHAGDTVIARYTAPGDGSSADSNTEMTILTYEQPFQNHNGGTGGGGGGGDRFGNAQDRGQLLGKMLRIDVDSGDRYGIPPDNPFIGEPGARGEVWAVGLRNPWRYSFDKATGDLYIADVGQNA